MIAEFVITWKGQACSAVIYLFKANNRNSRTRCRIGIFIINFEQISHIVLVFPMLTMNK